MGMFDKLFGDKSSIDRVVGGTDQEQRRVRKQAEKFFKDQEFDELVGREIPKTREDIEMLELIAAEIDLLREKYGLPSYRVPPENVHLMMPDDPFMRAPGEFKPAMQAMFLKADTSRAAMMHIAFHEMVHFKSFQSLQPDGEKTSLRRVGLSAELAEGDIVAFGALNEAVTEELTIRFMRKMADHPFIKPEREAKERLYAKWGKPDRPDFFRAKQVRGPKGEVEYILQGFGYPKERQALNALIDKLMEKTPERFRDREEIFEMFAGGAFNGHLLELARLIEDAFGQGSFRKIAEFGHDRDKLLEFVESL
ncbi:MAG: hypothetical protein AAB554_03715 [Patescibacteria group bacterium]